MTPLVMVVNASVNARSAKDSSSSQKRSPTRSPTPRRPGEHQQLVGEWIKSEAGIKVLEVPYKAVNARSPNSSPAR